MTRLDSLSPQLAAQLKRASDKQRQAACKEACVFAVQKSALDDASAREALEKLVAGAPISDELKQRLAKLLDQLDEFYFEFREEGQKNDVTVFSKARAVAALLSASNGCSLEAVMESVYEAANVMDDPAELVQRVSQAAG